MSSILLLCSLALLAQPNTSVSAVGNCVTLAPDPDDDPAERITVTAVVEITALEDGRLKVVVETSPDGEHWLPTGDVTVTYEGLSILEIPTRHLYPHVRARTEVRGALTYNAKVTLHSDVPLTPAASPPSDEPRVA